jgi:prepilin-type N-terminal cleavage/methylation domain-containing protein
MKHGFTLVELSIVLVIIGLLIGGILVGQSMIESAKINRFINDLRQYEIATIQFYKKFKKYPGDSGYFTPPGDNDNQLYFGANGTNDCAAAPNAAFANDEAGQFWAHLSQSKMLSKNFATYSPTPTCAGGIHTSPFLSLPYVKIKPNNGTPCLDCIVTATKLTTSNLWFTMYVDSSYVFQMENKLGSKNNDMSNEHNMVGLVNVYGIGNCSNEGDYSPYNCSNPDKDLASYGLFRYFIAPQ